MTVLVTHAALNPVVGILQSQGISGRRRGAPPRRRKCPGCGLLSRLVTPTTSSKRSSMPRARAWCSTPVEVRFSTAAALPSRADGRGSRARGLSARCPCRGPLRDSARGQTRLSRDDECLGSLPQDLTPIASLVDSAEDFAVSPRPKMRARCVNASSARRSLSSSKPSISKMTAAKRCTVDLAPKERRLRRKPFCFPPSFYRAAACGRFARRHYRRGY